MPLADPVRFGTFLGGVSVAGGGAVRIAAPSSPEGRLGVRAVIDAEGLAGVLRVSGHLAIVDLATAWDDRALPRPLEVARRVPLGVKRSFADAGGGARQLIDGELGAALYVDGRRLGALAEPIAWAAADTLTGRARREAARRDGARCRAQWDRLPGAFDDLVVTADAGEPPAPPVAAAAPPAARAGTATTSAAAPGDLVLHLAWGMADAAKPGRGRRLDLPTRDDAALPVDTMSRFAVATVSTKLVSLAPLRVLPRPRGSALEDFAHLAASIERCPGLGGAAIAVRHWPQLAGLLVAGAMGSKDLGLLGPLMDNLVTRLRNIDYLLRDAVAGRRRWAVAATFDPSAAALFDLFFAAADEPERLAIGKRRARIYPLGETAADLGDGALAREDLPDGKLLVVVADARETIQWAYAGGVPTPRPHPPAAIAHVDGPRLASLLAAPSPDDENPAPPPPGKLVELLARLGRLDAELESRRDLFVLTVHGAPR